MKHKYSSRRGLRGYEDAFSQQATQIVENYKLRGRTCSAAKSGLEEAARYAQSVIMAASGEYADSRYDRQAQDLIERFKKDIDKACGCARRSR